LGSPMPQRHFRQQWIPYLNLCFANVSLYSWTISWSTARHWKPTASTYKRCSPCCSPTTCFSKGPNVHLPSHQLNILDMSSVLKGWLQRLTKYKLCNCGKLQLIASNSDPS
jgi:hypothetical protein